MRTKSICEEGKKYRSMVEKTILVSRNKKQDNRTKKHMVVETNLWLGEQKFMVVGTNLWL
jgi:hypothetical protein